MHKNCCHLSCRFCLRYAPNRLSAGALPHTLLGSLQRFPRLPSWFRGWRPHGEREGGRGGSPGMLKSRVGKPNSNLNSVSYGVVSIVSLLNNWLWCVIVLQRMKCFMSRHYSYGVGPHFCRYLFISLFASPKPILSVTHRSKEYLNYLSNCTEVFVTISWYFSVLLTCRCFFHCRTLDIWSRVFIIFTVLCVFVRNWTLEVSWPWLPRCHLFFSSYIQSWCDFVVVLFVVSSWRHGFAATKTSWCFSNWISGRHFSGDSFSVWYRNCDLL